MKVSKATKKNWQKLNVESKILDTRANKTMSKKRIIPKELFENKNNIRIIEEITQKLPKRNIKNVMYSLCLNRLIYNNLLDQNLNTENPYINKFIRDIGLTENKDIIKMDLPNDEADILGIIYQCLQTEGKKNQKGSYYTPKPIVEDMVSKVNASDNSKILDPCCGTGMYLLNINIKNPENLYGFDIDKIAVMIAKTNLFIKYKDKVFEPQIYVNNFLKTRKNMGLYDYIITNVPWGADTNNINKKLYPEILTGESFSYFLIKASRLLKDKGKLNFLLPESFLNVKSHSDIRKFIIENMTLDNITLYPDNFSGVVTKSISIVAVNEKTEDYEIKITNKQEEFNTNKRNIQNNCNYVITCENDIDKRIQGKIAQREYLTLENSIWALGIVTGNNKEKLINKQLEGYEPIYTGKEICKFNLLPCKNYILYDRSSFQQIAPDEIYRAKEKLVYKFISKKITVAYDDSQKLFLNSANILIPNVENMNIKTVMAFLNSTLFQYLYIKRFGEIKILRGNLSKLPLPKISKSEDEKFIKLVNKILEGQDVIQQIQSEIYKMYGLTIQEIEYIEGVVNGTTKSNIK